MLRGVLLSIVTLGWYTPYFQSHRRAFFVNNARFGSEPFMYDGHGRDLFGDFARALLLAIPTLGLSWIWASIEQRAATPSAVGEGLAESLDMEIDLGM